MKILYVAGNPFSKEDLMVLNEVTQLQAQFSAISGETVRFESLPELAIEDFGLALSKHRPDILHISAHGSKDGLAMRNASGKSVKLTGKRLRAFLNMEKRPRLVYLNACDSQNIGKELKEHIPMVIGTTAPITNRAAVAAAILFYDRVISGETVQTAYDASRALIETIDDDVASSKLFASEGVVTRQIRLHAVPHIIARFSNDNYSADKGGFFKIEVGVWGCPPNTSQLLLFTDDLSLVIDDEDEWKWEDDEESFMASQLCKVIRESPIRQVIWSSTADLIFGDYRIFATGISGSGASFVTTSMLCEALEAYWHYVVVNAKPPKSFHVALAELRRMDGYEGQTLLSGIGQTKKANVLKNKSARNVREMK